MRQPDSIVGDSKSLESLYRTCCATDQMHLVLISTDPRIPTIINAIESNPSERIEELQKRVSLGKYWLRHIFRRATGVSLRAFITHCRMNLAASLLRSSDMRLSEIARVVGYHHLPSFVRAFKKHFACNPGAYRIAHKTLRAVGLTERHVEDVLAQVKELANNTENAETRQYDRAFPIDFSNQSHKYLRGEIRSILGLLRDDREPP